MDGGVMGEGRGRRVRVSFVYTSSFIQSYSHTVIHTVIHFTIRHGTVRRCADRQTGRPAGKKIDVRVR